MNPTQQDSVAVLQRMADDVREELAEYPNGDHRWRAAQTKRLEALDAAIAALQSQQVASADRGEAVAVDSVLAALGHVRKPNERCLAVEDHSAAKGKPGPPAIPVFCYLPAGHAGLHRCNLGGDCHPYPMREPIVMREALPDLCAKCRVAWPCADAKAAYAATPPSPAESAAPSHLAYTAGRCQHGYLQAEACIACDRSAAPSGVSDAMRESFERWVRRERQSWSVEINNANNIHGYADTRTFGAWIVWQAARQPQPGRVEGMELDARRWRALIGSARVRVLGSAGLHTELNPYGEPWDGYAHIGLELWTKHNPPGSYQTAIDDLTKYADIAITADGQVEGME